MKSHFETIMHDQMDHAMMIDSELGLDKITAYVESETVRPAGLRQFCLIPHTHKEIDDFLRIVQPKIKHVEAVRALLALNLMRMIRSDATNSPNQE